MYLKWLFIVLLAAPFSNLFAQTEDSVSIQIGTTLTTASKDFQPLWLVANKFGSIADIKTDAASHFRIANRRTFNKDYDVTDPGAISNNAYIDLGIDIYNNEHFSKVLFQEGYVKVGYRNWQIRGGRFKERSGDIDQDLSSGSWGISGNALPIPKVGVIVTDYTNVPYTNGWLKFKGQLSHGWFGNNRFMKDAFLHEKMFYMQLGKNKLKVYGGIQHFVEWGGRRGDIQLEKSWKGFFDVLTVKRADDGSYGGEVRYANRPGDQRGLLEYGATWENDELLLSAYNQTMFETGRDIDIRNIDRLLGVNIKFKNKETGLKKALVEFIHTKQMLDFVEPFDRQSYYNNGYYRTGWEYENRIVGTPLFYNRARYSKFSNDYQVVDWDAPDNQVPANSNIINNRIIGLHVGGLYNFSPTLAGKTMLTYTKNYGSHAPSDLSAGKTQCYTLQEISVQFPNAGISTNGRCWNRFRCHL